MNIPTDVRWAVRQRAHFTCEFCGVTETNTGGELTIDHFQPHTKGGTDAPETLLSCRLCNEKVRRENGNDDSRLKRGRLTEGAHLQGNRLTWRRKPKGTIACR
jgi:hypothetical protein